MCAPYQDLVTHYPMSDIWMNAEEAGGECLSTNFFRWVVEEANDQLDYDNLLFTDYSHEVYNDSPPLPENLNSYQFEEKYNPYFHSHDVGNFNTSSDFTSDSDDSESSKCCLQRGPGRPKSDATIRKLTNKKTGKLWEFLRNLLQDERTCPSLIKWDNYNEGTFKFVQSEKVAQLWGNRKNNTKMNYEKLSRAMRYYYRSQVLLPVAGKRLVYKFGPTATGWRTENPIL